MANTVKKKKKGGLSRSVGLSSPLACLCNSTMDEERAHGFPVEKTEGILNILALSLFLRIYTYISYNLFS